MAPPLTQLFSVGQYVRCVIKDLGSSSSSDKPAAANGSSSSSSKKRITATLRLKVLLSGVSAAAAEGGGGYFGAGQVVPAVVSSVEDRGYSLAFGVKVSNTATGYRGPAGLSSSQHRVSFAGCACRAGKLGVWSIIDSKG